MVVGVEDGSGTQNRQTVKRSSGLRYASPRAHLNAAAVNAATHAVNTAAPAPRESRVECGLLAVVPAQPGHRDHFSSQWWWGSQELSRPECSPHLACCAPLAVFARVAGRVDSQVAGRCEHRTGVAGCAARWV